MSDCLSFWDIVLLLVIWFVLQVGVSFINGLIRGFFSDGGPYGVGRR